MCLLKTWERMQRQPDDPYPFLAVAKSPRVYDNLEIAAEYNYKVKSIKKTSPPIGEVFVYRLYIIDMFSNN